MKDTKTIYEQLGGTYREENGNLVPDVELPEQKPIGKYGRMHLDYLKQHRRGTYSHLLMSGRLNEYLHGIDEQAREMLHSIIDRLAVERGVNEALKAENALLWVQEMNNCKAAAEMSENRELAATSPVPQANVSDQTKGYRHGLSYFIYRRVKY